MHRSGSTRTTAGLALAALMLCVACTRPATREYELIGQVLAVSPERREITIKHGDIEGFMPAMTMPFQVRDAGLLTGRAVGDVVQSTLVVEENGAYLKTMRKLGTQEVSQAATPDGVSVLAAGAAVADADLVDETGQPFRLSRLRGNVIAVTFIYTRCPLPNYCPLMDRHFQTVQERLRQDPGLGSRAQLLSVTLDPAFDRPEVLVLHGAALKADARLWHFATGEAAAVTAFAAQFGVSAFRDQPGTAELVHNLRTAVVDREGRLARVFNGNEWTPDELVAAMKAAD